MKELQEMLIKARKELAELKQSIQDLKSSISPYTEKITFKR